MTESQSGQTKTGLLLTALFFLTAAYSGSQIIPFFYYASELENQFQAQANVAATTNDAKIRKYLLKIIKEYDIPVNAEEALKINRYNNKMEIEMEYSEVFFIDLGEWGTYDIYEFKFHPKGERVF